MACTRHLETSARVESVAWNQGSLGSDWHLEVTVGERLAVNKFLNGDEAPHDSQGGEESLVVPSGIPADPTDKAAVERSFHVIQRIPGLSHRLPYVEPRGRETPIADEGS